jgi:hypothetical protein
MKKQLLIAAVAATMGTAAIADVSIGGNAKFEYFNTEDATTTSNKTNTEVNLNIRGKSGDTAVVLDLEFDESATDGMDIENMYLTTKVGDVDLKLGNYSSGTTGILGEIDAGQRAHNKITATTTIGGIKLYAGTSGTSGAGSQVVNPHMFAGASMDISGATVQFKHVNNNVDAFAISGNVAGFGVRLEQKSDTAANGDVVFGHITKSFNGLDFGYAWIDADKADKVTEGDSSIFAVEMSTVDTGVAGSGRDNATENQQVSVKTSVAGNTVTLKSGSVKGGLGATTDLDYSQLGLVRGLAGGTTLALTYTDKDASATTDTQTFEVDLSVKF